MNAGAAIEMRAPQLSLGGPCARYRRAAPSSSAITSSTDLARPAARFAAEGIQARRLERPSDTIGNAGKTTLGCRGTVAGRVRVSARPVPSRSGGSANVREPRRATPPSSSSATSINARARSLRVGTSLLDSRSISRNVGDAGFPCPGGFLSSHLPFSFRLIAVALTMLVFGNALGQGKVGRRPAPKLGSVVVTGTPAEISASAVVNFAELAR